MLFPKFIYKVKKKNKNLGDIKCVEAKRVFCIKHEKKKHIDKKLKSSDLVSTTVEFVPKRGVGWGGMTC